jgi:hypothetical protein
MSDLVIQSSQSVLLPLPTPKEQIEIRLATEADIPAIDGLQKQYSKQLGFMPRKALEGKVRLGQVVVAEARRDSGIGIGDSGEEGSPPPESRVPNPESRTLGYLIGQDQYFKRDDCGIVYQICVASSKQRAFIGAALLKAQFERSAWGCKLYCCWCAQDLEANRFWESMGFVPLAFRAGSEKKRRVHIFWQKRIREGDATTAWWFPSETKGGSMMEDRLVFPIPPGTKWWDAKPIVLPSSVGGVGDPALLGTGSATPSTEGPKRRAKAEAPAVAKKPQRLSGGLMFAAPAPVLEKAQKKPREKRPKVKNDPRLVSAARELRDRWLEKVNDEPELLAGAGKYEVARMIGRQEGKRVLTLPEAA